MKCPYLSSSTKKECVRMVGLSMDGDLTEFDLAHFCDGNPVYCYYFRLPALQALKRFEKPENPPTAEPQEIKLPTSLDEELSLKIEEDSWQK